MTARTRLRRLRPLIPAAGLVAVASFAPFPASAQEVPDKTRVYVVVIDGLNPEEVALMPFLSSLAGEGTYYQESRAVMVAETIPNHVSMVTGVYPDRSGIPANSFPGVEGSGAPEVGTGDEAIEAGDPRLLEADSLFTLVERQCPQLTTAAVTSKDYLFTILDHDRTGDGKVDADSNFANVDDPTFIPVAGLTPDERTIAEAARVVEESDPDFLFLNLGSVDRSGHADVVGGLTTPTGSRPAFRDVQRTNTDTYLRAFVQQLQQQGTWEDTALLITADHSMDWSLPTDGVTVSDNEDIADIIDEFVVAQNGGASLFSLRDRTRPDGPELLKRLRDSAIGTDGVDEALYRQPNPVDGGEQHWVGRVHPGWHQTGPRSGDVILTVQDGRRSTEPSSTSNPIPGNHGMPSTLRVPTIVAGGLDVMQRTVPGDPSPNVRAADQSENVDIAPTAAWLLGVEPPAGEGFDGRALEEAFGSQPEPSCNVAAGAPAPDTQAPEPSESPSGSASPSPSESSSPSESPSQSPSPSKSSSQSPSPSESSDSQQSCAGVPEATAYVDRDRAREVHKRSIDCVIAREIARGEVENGAKVYRPLQDVTREQMATFIVNTLRAAGTELPEPKQDAFDDIAESFHREPIEILAAAGIVEGQSGGASYAPQETVTRQQMASFMVRAAQFAVEPDLAETGERRFTDVPDGGIHSEAIAIGDDNALFRGTTATTFSPTVVVMRDQMASFLTNLLGVAAERSSA